MVLQETFCTAYRQSKGRGEDWHQVVEQEQQEVKLNRMWRNGSGRNEGHSSMVISKKSETNKINKIAPDQGLNTTKVPTDLNMSLEDNRVMSYQFEIADHLCGKLIGFQGKFIKMFRKESGCDVVLDANICSIVGTKVKIDKCLEILGNHFARNLRKLELSLDQVNLPPQPYLDRTWPYLALQVLATSLTPGGAVVLQQPSHHALHTLETSMTDLYSCLPCPSLPPTSQPGTVCAAPYLGVWRRVLLLSLHRTRGTARLTYLDHGGYASLPLALLRQIKVDFLQLPFQALECQLANTPTKEECWYAGGVEEVGRQEVVQARVVGVSKTGVPLVHLHPGEGDGGVEDHQWRIYPGEGDGGVEDHQWRRRQG